MKWILVAKEWDRKQVLLSREPVQNMKGLEMDEIPFSSWQPKSTETRPIFHHKINSRAAVPVQVDAGVHGARVWICVGSVSFQPVSGVKGQVLKIFFFASLCLPALQFLR